MEELLLTIDNAEFKAEFEGFNHPLKLSAQNSASLVLQPWTFEDHFKAMDASCIFPESGPQWDQQEYLRFFTEKQDIHQGQVDQYSPAILWWASGGTGHAEPQSNIDHTLVQSDSNFFKIHTLNFREYLQVEKASSVSKDGELYTNPIRFLEEMTRLSVKESSIPIHQANAWETRILLEVSSQINQMPGFNTSPQNHILQTVEDDDLFRITLLSQNFGLTYKEVLNLPAWEFNYLEKRLNEILPKKRSYQGNVVSSPGNLSQFPDSVVIQVEDD